MGLHYEVAGDGPPLLLLPGAALDGTSWLRAGFVGAWRTPSAA